MKCSESLDYSKCEIEKRKANAKITDPKRAGVTNIVIMVLWYITFEH